MIFHPAVSSTIERTGRWQSLHDGDSSLLASWSGASLSFIHTGHYLGIGIGPLTARKEPVNGGTPMLACVISKGPNSIEGKETKLYHDLEPSSIVELFVASSSEEARKHRTIQLVLIDWASVLEIEGFYTETVNGIMKPSSNTHSKKVRVLHIGDSISCGASNGSQPIPRGCLDAFPFIARDILSRKTHTKIEVNLIALPGVSLTGPMKNEKIHHIVMEKGMKTRFWDVGCFIVNQENEYIIRTNSNHQASPWSDSKWTFERECSNDILVVALGTNDEARGVDANLFQDELCAFISKVYQLNIDTLKHVIIIVGSLSLRSSFLRD
ncbi:hypothetical protein H0H93_006622 [Arthromyces matolae]|nr:hypothetical protein H0H93_006622 [Arthromyces matolae]